MLRCPKLITINLKFSNTPVQFVFFCCCNFRIDENTLVLIGLKYVFRLHVLSCFLCFIIFVCALICILVRGHTPFLRFFLSVNAMLSCIEYLCFLWSVSVDENVMSAKLELTPERILDMIESAYPNPISIENMAKYVYRLLFNNLFISLIMCTCTHSYSAYLSYV